MTRHNVPTPINLRSRLQAVVGCRSDLQMPSGPSGDFPLLASMFAYWDLDGGWEDDSGNGYDMTAVNSPGTTTGFGGRTCMLIDWTLDNYLNRSSGIAAVASGIWTACGWVSPVDTTEQHFEFFRLARASDNRPIFEVWANRDSHQSISCHAGLGFVESTFNYWTDNQEVFWLVEHNLSTGAITLTLDGSNVFTSSYSAVEFTADNIRIGLGRYGHTFNGRIGPIGVWNRALIEDEHAWLAAAARGFADVSTYAGS